MVVHVCFRLPWLINLSILKYDVIFNGYVWVQYGTVHCNLNVLYICPQYVSLTVCYWRFLAYFFSTDKKGKYPDRVQIFTFFSSIDLFDVKDFKRNLTDGNLIRKSILKRIWCCSFHGYRNFARECFLGGEHLTSSSTKTAQTINFKLCTHISNRLLHKTMPAFFLIMSHSFFIAIIQRVLKAYFAWKQLKVDYSKNIWKEENRGHGFVCLLVG